MWRRQGLYYCNICQSKQKLEEPDFCSLQSSVPALSALQMSVQMADAEGARMRRIRVRVKAH